MPLKETYTPGGAVPEWVKEGGTVAVVHDNRHHGTTIEKGFVERITATQVILNDGTRYNLKRGLLLMGHNRGPYGPRTPFLADWDSEPVKSALREQFLRNTARVIEQKTRHFADAPTGQKAHELIGLLVRWLHTDGTVVEWGTNYAADGRIYPEDNEADARAKAASTDVNLYMRAPGVLAGKWVMVAE